MITFRKINEFNASRTRSSFFSSVESITLLRVKGLLIFVIADITFTSLRSSFDSSPDSKIDFKKGLIASLKVGWFSNDFLQSIQICGTAANISIQIAPQQTIGIIWIEFSISLFHYEKFESGI